MTNYRKKLIEVALPLEAINEASAREKSIRHGHPSTLHLWWARRPLAACRAVIFASLVDDPNAPDAPPAYVDACKKLPRGKNAADHDTPRQRLFDFIERLVLWESTTDERVLKTARELIRLSTAPDGGPPPLLDPFAGGGSIPLEAQRLGLEAHASDLNPVAVMINKALIEIPPTFANQPPVNPRDNPRPYHKDLHGMERITTEVVTTNQTNKGVTTNMGLDRTWKGAAGLAADVRYYGEWMRDRAWERIGHLYPPYTPPKQEEGRAAVPAACRQAAGGPGETVIAWLWARTVKCPNPACGAQMPLVSSFWLSKKKGHQAWVEPKIDKVNKTVQFTVKTGKGQPPDPPKVSRGAKFRCLVCGEVAPDQHLKDEGMADRMGAQLMAIVTEGQNGRSYYAPSQEHETIAAQASPEWRPQGELPGNTRWFSPPIFGMSDFADLFTPRQLTALTTFSDLVGGARALIREDAVAAGLPDDDIPLREGGTGARAYAEAVSVYLAFAIDRSTDYWSSNVTWTPSGEFVGHTFTRQAIPMVWDYAEANPFSNASGNWDGALNWITMVLEKLIPIRMGRVIQQDAASLHHTFAIPISTDPPYYDNIGYADLSDYFYVWMRPALSDVYPELFSTMLVPKTEEMIASPYRYNGDTNRANQHFESGLQQAFSAMRDIILNDYPLTVYYAFKQEELVVDEGTASTGWETMLNGLITSGFAIVGTWPMRTERGARSVSLGTNALASSIVLVCRPRPADAPITSRREFVSALRKELPPALREMQSGNIAPVDLAQASIGPGMAVYSRYGKVLEPNGDPLTVRTALQLINQVLDAYLTEQEGDIDGESRFAVAWFEQYGFTQGDFGTADVLARAKNTSVDTLARAGFLDSGAGKVRLLGWDELDPGRMTDHAGETPALPTLSVWEAVHYLIERLNTHGEQGAAMLLARMPADLAADARQLAYRLYSLCERKGWAAHARDYNALVVSWGASQEQAQGLREQLQQGRLFT